MDMLLKDILDKPSRKRHRIKVTPDLHPTYCKNGGGGEPGVGIENEKI